MDNRDDAAVVEIVVLLEQAVTAIKRIQADSESRLDKRALSLAITHAETAQLWAANARQ